MHKCARFCSDPRQSHIDAVVHLVKYLQFTRDKGRIILNPNKDKSFETYADADYAGNWNRATSQLDPRNRQIKVWLHDHVFVVLLIFFVFHLLVLILNVKRDDVTPRVLLLIVLLIVQWQ